jgi:hypothetical protein
VERLWEGGGEREGGGGRERVRLSVRGSGVEIYKERNGGRVEEREGRGYSEMRLTTKRERKRWYM